MALRKLGGHDCQVTGGNFHKAGWPHPNQEARGTSFPGYRCRLVFCTLVGRSNQLPLVRQSRGRPVVRIYRHPRQTMAA